MIKDPRCLKLLLQHKWIQENIDEPVDFPGANAKEDEKTTALHVAVSNRRYANAILLLDHLPKPRWKHSLHKTPNLEQLNEKENLEEEETIERHPAFINQKSAAGLVPLYIAVFLNDYKMVRILLFFKADPTILCKDITPIHLAEGIKKKNDEKKTKLQSQQISQEKKEKGSKLEIDQIDQIDLIVEALHNQEKEENKDTLDILKKEIAPELLDNNGEYSSDSDEEENNDDDNDNESVVLSPSEVAEIKGLLKRIHKIISKK